MIKGKDGKEFNMARYIEWAKYGSSSIQFNEGQKARVRPKKFKRWSCPICGQMSSGRGIPIHKGKCK